MKSKKLMSLALSSVLLLSTLSPVTAASWKEEAKDYLVKQELVQKEQDLTPELAGKILSQVTGEEIRVTGDLTRENMAVYLAQAAEKLGFNPSKDDKLAKAMEDFDQIQPEAKDAMVACFNLGILVGDGKALMPKNPMDFYQFAQGIRGLETIPAIEGKVKEINKYGHVVTELTEEELNAKGFELGDILTCQINGHIVDLPYVKTYVNVDNKAYLIFNDKGHITLAINMGNFSETHQVKPEDTFTLKLAYRKGYLEDFTFRDIGDVRTNNREDYASDEIFANFRSIHMGKIPEGTLYRSSNPANEKLGRASYVDKFIEEAGVNASLDFSEDSKKLEGFFEEKGNQSHYYKALYEAGHVIALNMNADFTSKDFNEKLNQGLKFLIQNDGPYLVHCTEGKDRAGYVSALLGALMGGSVDELVKDYMLSYVNYYFVEPDSKQYQALADSNIMTTLKIYAGVETDEELRTIDLEKAVEKYMVKTVGLTEEEVAKVKEKLSQSYEKQDRETLLQMEKKPIDTTAK